MLCVVVDSFVCITPVLYLQLSFHLMNLYTYSYKQILLLLLSLSSSLLHSIFLIIIIIRHFKSAHGYSIHYLFTYIVPNGYNSVHKRKLVLYTFQYL